MVANYIDLLNHGSHISAIINLYKAIGGGWVDTPVGQLLPEKTRVRMQERTDWGDLLTTPLPIDQTGPPVTSGVSSNE